MKQFLMIPILMLAIIGQVHSQNLLAQEKGIAFEQNLTWNEILQKARSEHKYIFVDCYASWCGPCKVMDRDVYTNDSLGEWMNGQYISVKVQMDSTGHDNLQKQKWYSVAHQLEHDYRIAAYPSFIFLSPDGEAVDKKVGERDAMAFMGLAKSAMDPSQQFYTLFLAYQKGDKNYSKISRLAGMAKGLGEDSLANALAIDYMHNYLLSLNATERWTRGNLGFLNDYSSVLDPDDKLFKLYFKDRQMINQVMGDSNYATGLINRVIYINWVKPLVQQGIKTNVEPDWHNVEKKIEKTYGPAFVDQNIVPGKVAYYRSTKQWALYAKYFFIRMKQVKIDTWQAGGMTNIVINNNAYEVFEYSNDKVALEAALSWTDKVLASEDHPDANVFDTKANILYKLGRTEEALKLEAESASLDPKDKETQDNFDKMKKGLPTWPVN